MLFHPKNPKVFWFILSLSLAVVYSLPALLKAFSGEFVVQDDARQHIFWISRFVDSKLFPNDLMANYFQSVAPAGYTLVYRLMANVGIAPLLLHKLLPPVLGAIATCYCFGICVELLPIPISGFIGALLLNQTLWMRDDIVAATPVAFVYPLLLAFLYYLLKRNLLGVASAIALIGLFYPQCVFVCAGVLILQMFWEIAKRFIKQSSSKNSEIENLSASPRHPLSASLLSESIPGTNFEYAKGGKFYPKVSYRGICGYRRWEQVWQRGLLNQV